MKYIDPHLRCVATSKKGVDLHHLITRKAGGLDEPWNMIPISREIHTEWHMKGTSYMIEKYPGIKRWMAQNGWIFCVGAGKWRHEKA